MHKPRLSVGAQAIAAWADEVTQDVVAELLGCSQSQVSRFARGLINPPYQVRVEAQKNRRIALNAYEKFPEPPRARKGGPARRRAQVVRASSGAGAQVST
jgi:transcriptional regulator with XRE-family HTH domain